MCDDGLQHRALRATPRCWCSTNAASATAGCCRPGRCAKPLPARCPAQRGAVNAARPSTPLSGHPPSAVAGAASLADLAMAPRRERRPSPPCAAGRCWPLAGMARPQRFFAMLREAGWTSSSIPAADHHDFAALASADGTSDVIVTEKDAVKIWPCAPALCAGCR